MSLKEQLIAATTEEEVGNIFATASKEDLKVLRKEIGRIELPEEAMDFVSGGTGYKDVVNILASVFGMKSNKIFAKIIDKVFFTK
ncbi:MAG: hypothetical protein KBT48_10355 [Firmicutes bacterium]|nr:hypothetical protein [Bacillota bacterium]